MRKPRNFFSRPEAERKWMLENTWCDHCQEADLGMSSPEEYEEEGSVFIQGTCSKCGARVVSEIETREIK
jgi:hypothetical protein